MPGSNVSLVIGIKHKAKENFCMAAMLLYILPEIMHLKRCIFLIYVLTIHYFRAVTLNIALMSPVPCICNFVITNHRQ
jgi:hypothetical protein